MARQRAETEGKAVETRIVDSEGVHVQAVDELVHTQPHRDVDLEVSFEDVYE